MRGILLGAVLLASIAAPASALTSVGDTWIGNSWGQRFEETAASPFDCMRIDWIFGSQFELPSVFEDFSDEGWAASWETPMLASARGSAVTGLGFDIIFSGDIEPTAFTFATYLEDTPQDYFRAEYAENPLACVWIIEPIDDPPPPPPPLSDIPEPVSVLLVGTGLTAAGIIRLKKR